MGVEAGPRLLGSGVDKRGNKPPLGEADAEFAGDRDGKGAGWGERGEAAAGAGDRGEGVGLEERRGTAEGNVAGLPKASGGAALQAGDKFNDEFDGWGE